MISLDSSTARPLSADEQALLAEWRAAAGDIGFAYVSSRRSDPASHRHRIVITRGPTKEPLHLVYAPAGRNIWIVLSFGLRPPVKRFASLRAALNSVRPFLVKAETLTIGLR